MSSLAERQPAIRIVPALVLAYLGFVTLGLPDGLLGVAWPTLRADFGVPVGAVGFVLAFSTAGYLVSSVSAGFLLATVGVGRLLAASTALVAAALAGYALAPVLGMVVGCALLLGLGSGAIDSGLNAYAASHFSARHMNWMHAAFGFGAMVGPLVMSGALTAGLGWRAGYGAIAAVQAMLTVTFALTITAWANGAPAQRPAQVGDAGAHGIGGAVAAGTNGIGGAGAAGTNGPLARTWAMPMAWLGVFLFVVYTGVEVATGLWAYTLLTEARGVPEGLAGGCVSGYWGSLFLGRILYGLVAERLRSGRVVLVCLVAIAAGAGLLAIPGTAWLPVAGLILIGGFAAPVFPLLTLTTVDRVGSAHADRAIGMQMGGAGLGGALLPAGIGVLVGQLGADALGVALLVLTVIMIAAYLPALLSAASGQPSAQD